LKAVVPQRDYEYEGLPGTLQVPPVLASAQQRIGVEPGLPTPRLPWSVLRRQTDGLTTQRANGPGSERLRGAASLAHNPG
jgi:hypothetical protein